MPTNTPRLGLIKPAGSEEVDVAQLNANSDKLDTVPGILVVTSTTRPAAPFVGQTIYETDTQNYSVWSGSRWDSLSVVTPWTDLSYINNWTSAAGYGGLRYRRIPNGSAFDVEIIGSVLRRVTTTLAISVGNFYTVGVLPVGFRPVSGRIPTTQGYAAAAGAFNNAMWRVDSDGNLAFNPFVASGTIGTGGSLGDSVGMSTFKFTTSL